MSSYVEIDRSLLVQLAINSQVLAERVLSDYRRTGFAVHMDLYREVRDDVIAAMRLHGAEFPIDRLPPAETVHTEVPR
jgi:hypothetical protein